MLFLKLIELGLLFFVIAFIVTQLIMPVLEGRVLFPFFREKKYVAEYRKVKQEQAELDLQEATEEVAKSNSERKVK